MKTNSEKFFESVYNSAIEPRLKEGSYSIKLRKPRVLPTKADGKKSFKIETLGQLLDFLLKNKTKWDMNAPIQLMQYNELDVPGYFICNCEENIPTFYPETLDVGEGVLLGMKLVNINGNDDENGEDEEDDFEVPEHDSDEDYHLTATDLRKFFSDDELPYKDELDDDDFPYKEKLDSE